MDRVPNAWIRELCGVRKGSDERIDKASYSGRMERDRIDKSVCVGECAGSSLCMSQKLDRLIP